MKSRWYIMEWAEGSEEKDTNDYDAPKPKSEKVAMAMSIQRLRLYAGYDITSADDFSRALKECRGAMVDREVKALRLHLIKLVCERMNNRLYAV